MVHWMFSFSRALLIHRVRLAKALLLEVLPYDNKFCYVSPQLQLPEALSEYWSASPRNPPSCKKLQLPAWKCTSHYHSGTNFSDQENAEADIEPSTASKKTTWWDSEWEASFLVESHHSYSFEMVRIYMPEHVTTPSGNLIFTDSCGCMLMCSSWTAQLSEAKRCRHRHRHRHRHVLRLMLEWIYALYCGRLMDGLVPQLKDLTQVCSHPKMCVHRCACVFICLFIYFAFQSFQYETKQNVYDIDSRTQLWVQYLSRIENVILWIWC